MTTATSARPCFYGDDRPIPDPGLALVLGGARCVWDDLRALEVMLGGPWPGLVVAVNDIGVHVPYLDCWVTRHPTKLHVDPDHPQKWGWERQRAERGHARDYQTYGIKRSMVDHHADTTGNNGSSGFLGAWVGVVVTKQHTPEPRVVLCGIPMSNQPHFAESEVHTEGKPWASSASHMRGWRSDRGRMQLGHYVRSMSGNTEKLLGRPTPEWIRGER